jgi:hypothetical protein
VPGTKFRFLSGFTNRIAPYYLTRQVGKLFVAIALQRFAFDAAMALKEACTDKQTGKVTMDVKTAVAVQKLAGAWDTIADRLRILRGRGLPASERAKPRRARPVEPLEPL